MTDFSKPIASGKPKMPRKRAGRRKSQTRDAILAAATRIFAAYPYHTASIRMIGKAAGIDHPLINYYFPTKAALFEAVLKAETENYYLANIEWFSGVIGLGPEKGLSIYIDRFFAFALENPEVLQRFRGRAKLTY